MQETVVSFSGDAQPALVFLGTLVICTIVGLAIRRSVVAAWDAVTCWRERQRDTAKRKASQPLPTVVCTSCGHVASCVRMKDGTVYKPIAWAYPDRSMPMQGICGACRDNRYDGSL